MTDAAEMDQVKPETTLRFSLGTESSQTSIVTSGLKEPVPTETGETHFIPASFTPINTIGDSPLGENGKNFERDLTKVLQGKRLRRRSPTADDAMSYTREADEHHDLPSPPTTASSSDGYHHRTTMSPLFTLLPPPTGTSTTAAASALAATTAVPPQVPSAASSLKRTLSATATAASEHARRRSSGPRQRKPLAEHDPENHAVKRLREAEHLSWAEIAARLNDARIAAGRVPGLTDNAIYSRYARNAPRIAAANNETAWAPARRGVVAGRPAAAGAGRSGQGSGVAVSGGGDGNVNGDEDGGVNGSTTTDGTAPGPGTRPGGVQPNDFGDGTGGMQTNVVFTPELDELLVRAYHAVKADCWTLVAERLEEMGGPAVAPEACARRYRLL